MVKQFKSAAVASQAAVDNPVDVEFEIDGVLLTASPPTTGQLAMFMATQIDGDPSATVKAVMGLFEVILSEDDYAWVVERLQSGEMPMEILLEVVEFLGEEWSSRPTSSASVSSPSRTSTGKPSTAKPRSKARTRSA